MKIFSPFVAVDVFVVITVVVVVVAVVVTAVVLVIVVVLFASAVVLVIVVVLLASVVVLVIVVVLLEDDFHFHVVIIRIISVSGLRHVTGSWTKIHLKLSSGEICVANFIPPANGVGLGSYFCVKYLISA